MLINRDFSIVVSADPSPLAYQKVSQSSPFRLLLAENYFVSFDNDYQGSQNAGHGLIAACFRGQLELVQSLVESLSAGGINLPGEYHSWVYHGNFSGTHNACIALSTDVYNTDLIPYNMVGAAPDESPLAFLTRGATIDPTLLSKVSGFSQNECYFPRYPSNQKQAYLGTSDPHYLPWSGHHHSKIKLAHPPSLHGTPLHWAVLGNQLAVVRFLCSRPDIDLHATVQQYQATALDLAQKNKLIEIVLLLRNKMQMEN